MKIIGALVSVLTVTLLTGCGSRDVRVVRKGHLSGDDGPTIGSAYGSILKGAKWEAIRTEDGTRGAKVTGVVRDDDLRDYVLAHFPFASENPTRAEEEFIEKWKVAFTQHYESDVSSFLATATDEEVEGFVRKRIGNIDFEHGSAVHSYDMKMKELQTALVNLFRSLRMEYEGKTMEDWLSMYQSIKPGDIKRPDNYGDPDYYRMNDAETEYGHCGRVLKEMQELAPVVKSAEKLIQDKQAEFESDYAEAKKAKTKEERKLLKKCTPIMTAYFRVYPDGKNVASATVEVVVKGGPLDKQDVTLDTEQWEEQLLANR